MLNPKLSDQNACCICCSCWVLSSLHLQAESCNRQACAAAPGMWPALYSPSVRTSMMRGASGRARVCGVRARSCLDLCSTCSGGSSGTGPRHTGSCCQHAKVPNLCYPCEFFKCPAQQQAPLPNVHSHFMAPASPLSGPDFVRSGELPHSNAGEIRTHRQHAQIFRVHGRAKHHVWR